LEKKMSKIYKTAAAMATAVSAVILIAVTGSASAAMGRLRSAPAIAVKLDDRGHKIEPETTLTSSGRSSSK
jgi:hypothetical protein